MSKASCVNLASTLHNKIFITIFSAALITNTSSFPFSRASAFQALQASQNIIKNTMVGSIVFKMIRIGYLKDRHIEQMNSESRDSAKVSWLTLVEARIAVLTSSL